MLREAVLEGWKHRFASGAKDPLRAFKDEVWFCQLKMGAKKKFEAGDKAVYTGRVKCREGNRWVYP